jgi:hypothetical protein
MNTLKNITTLAPGTLFTVLGVEYKFLRIKGETHQQPNRNQWGRATGGTYEAYSVAVKVNRRHRGWQFSYLAIPVAHPTVIVKD